MNKEPIEVEILVTIKIREGENPPDWIDELIADIKHDCTGHKYASKVPIDKGSEIDLFYMQATILNGIGLNSQSEAYNLDIRTGDWMAYRSISTVEI